MLSHTAVLHAAYGRAEQMGRCLDDLCEPVQAMAGCLGVEVRQLPDDAACWLLESRWQSAAALHAFFAAPLLQQMLDHALQQGLLSRLHCEAA
ncbi:antibiotic biosynthesis monooxygenase [Pseudomonas sp.]|uniref:antibiotic biosynthesis monooxygenase n=1 Tax=Pseudomonas sp. TaxID=306 RepID=UPI003C742A2F